MLQPDTITVEKLSAATTQLFELAAEKILSMEAKWDASAGTPVFTVAGQYTTRGWTEWTQGFQYGRAILTYEVVGERKLLEVARGAVLARMAGHVTAAGVHDHGFNNLPTYGNLRRLMREGRIEHNQWEMAFYELALKASGAVQAMRWTATGDGGGFIHSFNGRHSLFIDTLRTIRSLGVAHQLGQQLHGENDRRINLLGRLVGHGLTTAKYNIYYGRGRDGYDLPQFRGRTAHEAIFNASDGSFRCPSTQQGYSPFSTWTRGLAWAVIGFAEELEFLSKLPESQFQAAGAVKGQVLEAFGEAARATADFYLDQATAADGIPYWDTEAPNLHKLSDWRQRPADPFNDHEPVDSSAAVIAAQGLIRLGRYLGEQGRRYGQAGLALARTLLAPPYLSGSPDHQGLILHCVYHRPNGWDHIPPGRKVPCGESCMWGDYHALELALLIRRVASQQPYLTFFDW